MARFEMDTPKEFLKELKLLLDVKYNALVMRATAIKIAEKKNYTDFRPESVEDIPTRNVDQFLRENKMGGLIGKPREESRKSEEPSTQKVAAPSDTTSVAPATPTVEKKETPAATDSTDEGAKA